jgi:hypothetical protein
METWRGSHGELLAQSVQRKPTPLLAWMVNRILNTRPPDSESWMALLRTVAYNPAASDETRAEAERFIEYQTGG